MLKELLGIAIIVAVAAALWAPPTKASAICAPRDQQTKRLALFGEEPAAEFKSNGDNTGMVVFINKPKRTVTVLKEFGPDKWCFVAAGKEFRLIQPGEQGS